MTIAKTTCSFQTKMKKTMMGMGHSKEDLKSLRTKLFCSFRLNETMTTAQTRQDMNIKKHFHFISFVYPFLAAEKIMGR